MGYAAKQRFGNPLYQATYLAEIEVTTRRASLRQAHE